MKKILFFFSFCIISLGMVAQEKKVISDEDIFRVYIGEPDVKPVFHACADLIVVPFGLEEEDHFPVGKCYDPFVVIDRAREKAEKETKCTMSATNSVVTIYYKTADVLNCDTKKEYNSSGVTGTSPKMPDETRCKHGHHKVEAVMVLGDGSTYSGRADYDCTYGGYQVPRTHKKSGRNAAGQRVTQYGFGSSADPYAPWYVEHTASQYIDLASFASSAKISSNELVKRILYYGITSFEVNGNDWGDGGIRQALFVGTGYKAKWDAFAKKESTAGMADWNAAKNEMKKQTPDFDKASRLFISGSKHLKKAHKFDVSTMDEADDLFINFMRPMFDLQAYDTAYMRKVVKAYAHTREFMAPPGDLTLVVPNQWAPPCIAELWLDMRSYNPKFFETYNRLYNAKSMLDEAVINQMNVQYEVFWKRMLMYSTTDPEFTTRAIANYMKNPLMGEDLTDTLITAKAKAVGTIAKQKIITGEYDLSYVFLNSPDSAMWNRSYRLSKDQSTRKKFFEYYDIVVTDLGQIMDTLCDMIIEDMADRVSQICHSQFDPIMGSQGKTYQDRSELFNYYYNLYDQVSEFTKELEQCADNKDKVKAAELRNLAHNKFGITKRQIEEDYRMGHTDNLINKTEAEREAIRSLLRNVRFQIYNCKQLTNFDPQKDLLVIAETGKKALENPTFGLTFSEAIFPITEAYVDGQLVNVKPQKSKAKYNNKLIYTYPGIMNPIGNNSFHCFIFKGKKAIKGVGHFPLHLNGQDLSIYYWIEAPNIKSSLTSVLNDDLRKQTYLKLQFNE